MTKGKLNGLDLFSGIGGNSLALGEWINTVAYCEQDRYAQAVLLSRMREGQLAPRPIWDDVRTLRGQDLPSIDIIVGGFPCQDISVAGRGAGLEGQRSGLFFEIVRLAQEIQPALLFLENVPAIRTRGLDAVVRTLSGLGYDCRWDMLSAYDVGASHKRERWFLLAAHAERLQLRNKSGRWSGPEREGPALPGNNGAQEPLADTHGLREPQRAEGGNRPRSRSLVSSEAMANSDLPGFKERWQPQPEGASDAPSQCSGQTVADGESIGRGQGRSGPEVWSGRRDVAGCGPQPESRTDWLPEPDVGRVAHGISFRVDRIKCLGNAVCPKQAKEAFERLMGLK